VEMGSETIDETFNETVNKRNEKDYLGPVISTENWIVTILIFIYILCDVIYHSNQILELSPSCLVIIFLRQQFQETYNIHYILYIILIRLC
jgi:hypothetical protein